MLHTLVITCEMKQPGVLVKAVRKMPVEHRALNTSEAAQGAAASAKLHVAAGSGTVLVKPGLFTAVVGIYSSVSLAASVRAKHAVHAKQAG